MENKIVSALRGIGFDQVEDSVGRKFEMKISKEEHNRISGKVFAKAGLKRPRSFWFPKGLVAGIAAVAIILTTLVFVGFDNVAASLGRIFSFIPGFGIVENNESIEYILAETVSAENETVLCQLNTAVATKTDMTLHFTLKLKSGGGLFEDATKNKLQSIQDGAKNRGIVLHAGSKTIVDYTGHTAWGEFYTYLLTYPLKQEDISPDTVYGLEFEGHGLTVEFRLTDLETFSSLAQIGKTACANDISITAIPTFSEGQVQVDLYPVNKSGYFIESFNKVYQQPYLGKDLQLTTARGSKTYSSPKDFAGLGEFRRYLFDIEPEDKDFTLKIPYLAVSSLEEKMVTLPIPKAGEKLSVGKKIKFRDCLVTIVDVERVAGLDDDLSDPLKITLKYDNSSAEKVMLHPRIVHRDSGSITFYDIQEDGTCDTVYLQLKSGQEDKVRVKFNDPLYLFLGEYLLSFSR